MTFVEYWAEQEARGFGEPRFSRASAESAWDAALCAISAKCFDRGQIRTGQEIHAEITGLHTWVKPTT